MLKYTDYDIVVELLPSDRFSAEFLWKDINFRIVYISASYTENQFIIRAVFSFLALIVFCIYTSRSVCGVKKHKQ